LVSLKTSLLARDSSDVSLEVVTAVTLYVQWNQSIQTLVMWTYM